MNETLRYIIIVGLGPANIVLFLWQFIFGTPGTASIVIFTQLAMIATQLVLWWLA